MLCPPIPNVLLKDLTYTLFYFSQNDKWQYVMAWFFDSENLIVVADAQMHSICLFSTCKLYRNFVW